MASKMLLRRTSEVIMAASLLFLLPVLALSTHLAEARSMEGIWHRPNSSHDAAVADFTTAVNQYAELHRRLENPLSALSIWADSEQTAQARRGHRAAIREARAMARRGDVFTSRVSAYLLRQIQLAGGDADIAIDASFGEWDENGLPNIHLAINDPLPWGVSRAAAPAVLERLPELPKELEYRFVGLDLVLFDAEANLVVDVLEGALRPDTSSDTCAPDVPPLVEGSPCDAHEELPMCWS